MQIEMLIENNLNFKLLEELEIYEYNYEENNYSLLEGMTFKKNTDYKIKYKTVLENFINSFGASFDSVNFVEFLSISIFDEKISKNFNYQVFLEQNSYNIRIIDDGLQKILSTAGYLLEDSYTSGASVGEQKTINPIVEFYNPALINCKITKIAGSFEFEYGTYLTVNGEKYTTSPVVLENITEKDEIIFYNDDDYLSGNVIFYPDATKSEIELNLPLSVGENITADTLTIEDFGFSTSISLYETDETLLSDSYSLFSLYKKIDDMILGIFSVQTDIERNKQHIASLDNRVYELETSTEPETPETPENSINIDYMSLNKVCNAYSMSEIPVGYLKNNPAFVYGDFTNLKLLQGQNFKDCNELKEIILYDPITIIPEFCFENCTKLNSVTLPNNLIEIERYAFSQTSIENITFPASLNKLGFRVFKNAKIPYLFLPKTIQTIKSGCFYGVPKASVLFFEHDNEPEGFEKSSPSNGYQSWDDGYYGTTIWGAKKAEKKEDDVFSGIEYNDNSVFITDYKLEIPETFILPDNVTINGINYETVKVRNNFFSQLTNPINLIISSDIFLGESMFEGSNIVSVETIGENEINLPYGIFSWPLDPSNISFKFSKNTKTIYNRISYKHKSQKIYFDGTIDFWCNSGLGRLIYDYDGTSKDCDIFILNENNDYIKLKDITNITFTENTYQIAQFSFCFCENLKNVDIPENITTLGSYAFKGCSSLTEINTKNIGPVLQDYVFSECTSLKKIVLPKIKNSLSTSIFSGCSALETLDFYEIEEFSGVSSSLPSIKSLIIRTQKVCVLLYTYMKNCPNLYVYVQDDLVEEYKVATNWIDLADRIKPLSEYVEEE